MTRWPRISRRSPAGMPTPRAPCERSWTTSEPPATQACASTRGGSTGWTCRQATGRYRPSAGRKRSSGSPARCGLRSSSPCSECGTITPTRPMRVFSSDADGTEIGMRVVPLERVGLYVPGGKAAYPSTVIMNAVPAVVAGVAEIVMVTPPAGGDAARDVVLAAARLAGVDPGVPGGGAQAIAALAYGTPTIPRVDKIVGPGNRFVTEAKRQVAGDVGIDMLAGSPQGLIISPETPQGRVGAAGLFAPAPHDEGARRP